MGARKRRPQAGPAKATGVIDVIAPPVCAGVSPSPGPESDPALACGWAIAPLATSPAIASFGVNFLRTYAEQFSSDCGV